MYCRKCGAQISDSAKFCDNCGSEIIKIKQKCYADKYKENKTKQDGKSTEQKRMEKHKDEKNPYISAAFIACMIALGLSIMPWNLIGEGIGTSLPMRIIIVVFALLADYHVTKAKQVNNLLYSKYGFRIKANVVSAVNGVSIFVTVIALFALFTI